MLDEKTEWDAHRKSRSHRRKETRDSRKEQLLRRQEEVQAQRTAVRAGMSLGDQE
jgi:hypothetical protein